jgi:argininosuccinate lyase
VVQLASQRGIQLDALPLEAYQALSPDFEADLYRVFDPWESVQRRNAIGGTAPQAVALQIEHAMEELSSGY